MHAKIFLFLVVSFFFSTKFEAKYILLLKSIQSIQILQNFHKMDCLILQHENNKLKFPVLFYILPKMIAHLYNIS